MEKVYLLNHDTEDFQSFEVFKEKESAIKEAKKLAKDWNLSEKKSDNAYYAKGACGKNLDWNFDTVEVIEKILL